VRSADALWRSGSVGARVLRGALLPASGVFRALTTLRNSAFDTGVLRARRVAVPVMSVGNISVGGTGKTPLANWFACELMRRGLKPALLLRGYGDDEILVHRALAPEIPVVADPDRLRAAHAAIVDGADALVLDDAFQHRQMSRTVDVVLVSADANDVSRWPLPSGPWREPLRALRRAHLVVITAKSATSEVVHATLARIQQKAPTAAVSVVRLAADALVAWKGGKVASLSEQPGGRFIVVSGIADPAAFEHQLAHAGVQFEAMRFSDHHPYSARDAMSIRARAQGARAVICTLKDAVKLGPVWEDAEVPLWYVSQRITIERGAESVSQILDVMHTHRRA
jgi:tetraacyldisaccharide 4'-kinase